jgi:hypothetical protein
VRCRGQAGEKALGRQAPREAIDHLTAGLALLDALPDTPARARHELALQNTLSVASVMTEGYAAERAGKAYTRARELSRRLEDIPQLSRALSGLSRLHIIRDELAAADEVAHELMRLADRTPELASALMAHTALAAPLLFRGEFVAAREHLERGSALYDPHHSPSLALLYGDDPGILCLCWASLALWYLGHPDQSLASMERARRLAGDFGPFMVQAFALLWHAVLHQLRRESRMAEERAEACITLARDQGSRNS